MTDWKPRRFYTSAAVVEGPDGFEIALDGKPVRTPYRAPLAVPTRAMAEAMAAEWEAQEDLIDPGRMPVTRSANSAIDKVRPQRAGVVQALAAYGETDLLCHRAEAPEGLVARQAAAWDPPLVWAARTLEARLRVTTGVLPVDQPAPSLDRLRAAIAAHDAFELTALHDLVALTGSAVLGLWTAADTTRADTAWAASRVDEDWQTSQWGEDAEAAAAAENRRAALMHAAAFLDLARADPATPPG